MGVIPVLLVLCLPSTSSQKKHLLRARGACIDTKEKHQRPRTGWLNGPDSSISREGREPIVLIIISPLCCAAPTLSAACCNIPQAQSPPSPSEKLCTPFGWLIFSDSMSSFGQMHTRQLQREVVGGKHGDAGKLQDVLLSGPAIG